MLNRDFMIGTIAIIATLLYLHIVHLNNLGFSHDSLAYLEGARNIKMGNGFIYNNGTLINHWPPLYSLMLAITSLVTNSDLMYTGQYLHAFLIIGVIFILNRILDELKINKYLSLFIIILIIVSAPFKIFLWFLSEGLFIFLVLFSYYYLILWLKKGAKKYLYFTAIFAGLIFLTRFAGIGLIAAYLIILFVFSSGSYIQKIKNVFLFLLPLCLVVMPWFLYSASMDSGLQDREYGIHLITGKKLAGFISVIKNWFFGSYTAVKIAPFVLILISYEIVKNKKRFFNLIPDYFTAYNRPLLAAITIINFYIVFLFISASFFDNGIPFDNRILFPIYPFLIIIIATLLQFAFKHNFKWIFVCTSIFLLISFSTSAFPVYKDFYKKGLGFTAVKWKNSPTLNYVSKDENRSYYSNATELLNLHTNKEPYVFPNNSQKRHLETIKKQLEQQSSQIVIIENFGWPNYLVSKNVILYEFRNFKFVNFEDGLIISGPSDSN